MGILCFCFPYHGVGGVPLLFVRLSEALAACGHRVAIVDYRDGFMAARCPSSVELIEYRDDGPVDLPADAILIFQAMTPWSIFPGLRPERSTRLLFWNCHPFNLVPTLPGFRGSMQASPVFGRAVLATVLRPYLRTMRRFVTLLESKGALVFMDMPNVVNTKNYLKMPIAQPALLPIPVSGGATVPRDAPGITKRGLRLMWVGRLVDFKFNILKYTISQLERVQPSLNVPLTMTVVGAGSYAKHLRQYTAGLCNLAVTFVDHVRPEALDDFLADGADVLLAMGTSALEGAKLGIPTLLLDVAYRPVPEGYVFRWLDKSRGYSLGDVLSSRHIVPGNRSLYDCLSEVLSGYAELSGRMVEYFRRNHALDTVAGRFIEVADRASCTWGDLTDIGLTRRGMAYSIFDNLRRVVRR